MSTANQLSRSARRLTTSARSFARSHEQDDADTREYLRLIASLHKEWDQLESQASASVMPQRHLMDAVIAETRHGAQVQMPATDLGPYSMSEFSLRALIRRTVDSVPGARALRSSFEHAPSDEDHRGLGVPETIFCRISAHVTTDSLPQLAKRVRDAVRGACHENLGVSPTVNVHIEDLHDDD
ncbi:Asp23/Gls24 family envelope stress response protein [uncultured Actinomyces sp.]|uniref:Asp23/Gls24 family envelope stress response protein n=1 Tax=uncultured Actinomyces sp. TaxID=249061 RepID=UPI0025FF988E|nr:Asp23/Gls24 family envelope stress response protein [uncultured Actinomyces sp.]